MIIPKRWITIPEVREHLKMDLIKNLSNEENVSDVDVDVETNKLCWRFFKIVKKLFMHERGDKAIEYPKTHVEPPKGGTHLHANEFIDLTAGVPGSGTKKFTVVGPGEKIHNIYGPYFGSPIVFEREEFEKFLQNLDDKLGKKYSQTHMVQKKFLEMHDAGTYSNKEAVWETYFCGHVSRRNFNAGFKDAKKLDPTFGKIGRPSAKGKK